MTNLVFDYDGTLHDCIKIYAPAFRKALQYLRCKKYMHEVAYSDSEIARWLGFNPVQMWESFAPHLPDAEKQVCSRIIGDEMVRLTLAGKASLYSQAEDVLSALKKQGLNMLFLSNCKAAYMGAHKTHFALNRYFSAFYCAEDFHFLPKHKIFGHIKDTWQGDFIIIGDRYQDMEIAEKHNLKSIGCAYGYGTQEELGSATCKVNRLYDIINLVNHYLSA